MGIFEESINAYGAVRDAQGSIYRLTRWLLVQAVRGNQIKLGNIHVEDGSVKLPDHLVTAAHGAHIALEVTARYVFMPFARFDDGLQAYHPLALYLAIGAIGIEDKPMPAQKLHTVIAQVFDGNPVRKHEMFVFRVRVLRLVHRFNRNLYAVSDLCGHAFSRISGKLINVFE